MIMRKIITIVFLIQLFWFSAGAQSLFENTVSQQQGPQWNGYVRGMGYGGGVDHDYASLFGEFSLQSNYSTGNVAFVADARFLSGYIFGEQKTTLQLKEAYATYQPGKFSVSLGQQIVNWGKTDGFNPTNNITPNNYFFLTSNADDQKLSNFMLRTKLQLTSGINWEVIAIPIYRPSVYRYDLFDMGANVSFADAVLPAKKFDQGSLATRLSFELKGVGFSLSWFNGYDPFYGFMVNPVEWIAEGPSVINSAAYYRKNTVGFDLELPLRWLIFRAEAAVNFTKDHETAMSIPNPGASAVAALEYMHGNFMVLLQYVGGYTFDYKALTQPELPQSNNPLELMAYGEKLIFYEAAQFNRHIFHQQEEWDHAFSLTARQQLAYETLELTATGYYNLTSEEWMVRPAIVWNAAESLSLSLGAQWMKGNDGTVFSHASKLMNGVFLELKTSF